MSELLYHTRHQYAAKLGRRVSRGEWERLNRAYDVHHANGRYRLVGRDADGRPNYTAVLTVVLKPETTKANRKVSLGDR